MSRVGKQPVTIPGGVTVTVAPDAVTVKGPKGELKQRVVPGVTIEVDEGEKCVKVSRQSDSKAHRALHGLYRSLVNNMVRGVTEGYEKRLRIVGTGYRVELQGQTLVMNAGYAHPVNFAIPDGIEVEVPDRKSVV
jgi:large subunit ribosomal protein L6